MLRSVNAHPDRLFYILEPHAGGDRVWEIDGYVVREPSGKENWTFHLTCPRCGHNLRLDSTRKALRVSEEGLETGEPLACAWPGQFGQCSWRTELAPGRGQVVDYRSTGGHKGSVRIDAIAKRA